MPPMKPEDPSRRDRPLTHNPFAALRGQVPDAPRPTGPTDDPPTAPAPTSPARGPFHGRVTVRRERSGRGGKTVTLAEGPGLAGRELDGLARAAASALGLGARVEGGALVLQGDQRERLARWLAGLGYAQVVRGN